MVYFALSTPSGHVLVGTTVLAFFSVAVFALSAAQAMEGRKRLFRTGILCVALPLINGEI